MKKKHDINKNIEGKENNMFYNGKNDKNQLLCAG